VRLKLTRTVANRLHHDRMTPQPRRTHTTRCHRQPTNTKVCTHQRKQLLFYETSFPKSFLYFVGLYAATCEQCCLRGFAFVFPQRSLTCCLSCRPAVIVVERMRYYPVRGWSHSLLPTDPTAAFSERGGSSQGVNLDAFKPLGGHQWLDEWRLENNASTSGGWDYAVDFTWNFVSKKSMTHFVRQRTWFRLSRR
jgi:hypothetical protein